MPLFDPEPNDLRGINALYDDRLLPELQTLESQRAAGLKKAWKMFFGLWSACVAIGTGIHVNSTRDDSIAFVALAVIGGGVGSYFLAFKKVRELKQGQKSFVLRELTGFLGFRYVASGHGDMLTTFKSMSLLPSFDRSSTEDGVRGEIGGLPFRMTDAHLEERRTTKDSKGRTQTEYRTVFRGALIQIQSPSKFSGETLLLRDRGKIFNFLGSVFERLPRVRLEDPRFEDEFEVYGSDQVASRYVLNPSVMERFLDLSRDLPDMTAAFYGDTIFCAFSHSDLLEVGSLIGNFTDPTPVRRTVQELRLPALLAEALQPGSTASSGDAGAPEPRSGAKPV